MTFKQPAWTQPLPEFGGPDGTTEALPYVLPEFSTEDITDPSGQWVSALSSPSVPSCTGRGTGTAVGKLCQIQISATGDDGVVWYSGFATDNLWFGTSEPAI